MKFFTRRLFAVITLALLLTLVLQPALPAAEAQSVSVSWSQPIRLTDGSTRAWSPTIASDRAGNVHILWAQSMLSGGSSGMGDTLYYTRWDGESWSMPSDVLVSPDHQGAEAPEIAVTPDGILHAIWGTGGANSQLLYARAPACCADDPRNWSDPISLGEHVNVTSAIVSDSSGVLHVVYTSLSTHKIVYQRSEDSGKNWSKPVQISGASQRSDEHPAYPRIAVDLRGRVHLVWSVMPYPGRAVAYSRSDDGGKTWKEPILIDTYDAYRYEEGFGPYLIDVETSGNDNVHVTWDGAPTVERHHAWSQDGGETWSDPDTFIPELSGGGRALWNDMVVDSAGVLHAVSIKQPWAAQWSGGWSQSVALSTRSYAEDIRIALSSGNQLHVVWLEVIADTPSQVYYVHGVSSAPGVKVEELPTQVVETVGNEPAATATAKPEVTASVNPNLSDVDPADVESVTSPARGVFLSAGAALVVLAVLIFGALRRRK